jgi:EAL domain-containing protein (putative c-di-GMP-specific phosphodiesterase class I)
MGRLADIPFEIIKIDISLIAAVDTDPRVQSVVTGITDMARRLGAMTAAEGVERVAQLAPLRQMGCDLAQGFHFSPSLAAAELEALLTTSASGASIATSVPVQRPAL